MHEIRNMYILSHPRTFPRGYYLSMWTAKVISNNLLRFHQIQSASLSKCVPIESERNIKYFCVYTKSDIFFTNGSLADIQKTLCAALRMLLLLEKKTH